MRGFQPDEQRQAGGNMGRDAVMAAIARQPNQKTTSTDQPKPTSGPMQSLKQVFSGTIFDPRSRQDKREREAGYANGGRVRPRGFVAGPGTGTSDSIKARLSDGEYVLPADTVQAVGVDALDALKDATHTPVASQKSRRDTEPLFAGGGLVEDERKRNSFGDAAAVANDHGVQQVMGQATQMTATPEVRAAIGQQLDAPVRTQSAVNQIPTDISGQRLPVRTQAAATPTAAPGLDADPQVRSDRDAFGSAWSGIKGASEDVGRAMADVATLVPRGLVGAYDSAVVRPMRAAGLDAAYLSPALVPDGVDPASMTPFTDQKRMRATTSAAATPVVAGVANAAPIQPGQDVATSPGGAAVTTRAGDAYMPAMDVGARGFGPAAPAVQQVAPGVYRQGNSFGDSEQAAAWGATGTKNPTANEILAADAIVTPGAQQQLARGFAPEQSNMATPASPVMTGASQQTASQPFTQAAAPSPRAGGFTSARGFSPAERVADINRTAQMERDNLIRAANLRDGVDVNRGTSEANKITPTGLMTQAQNLLSRGHLGDTKRANLLMSAATAMQENEGTLASARSADASRKDASEIDQRRVALDERRAGLDERVKGIDIRAAQRLEALQQRYASAKTDAERTAIAKEIRDLSGKESGSDWGIQVTPAVKNQDGSTSEASVWRYNKRTGDTQRVDGSPGGRPAIDSPQVQSIINDTSLSKEQRAAKLRQLGFQ